MRNKKVIIWITLAFVILVSGLGLCYLLVSWNASGRTFDNAGEVPHNKYALLLGTSPITRRGAHNFYFDNRIKAAVELYKAGKIEYIIASGGDYTGIQKFGCDEPAAIRDSLVARGIPEDKIILDYEGTRTLNSIAKARDVYDLDSVTLISQKYHNERAIYLSDKNGLYTIGYNAAPSPFLPNRIRNTLREIFARPKMFMDLILGEKPDINKGNEEVRNGGAHLSLRGGVGGREESM